MNDPRTIEDTFAALADPTRRGVIDLLRRKPRRTLELASFKKTPGKT